MNGWEDFMNKKLRIMGIPFVFLLFSMCGKRDVIINKTEFEPSDLEDWVVELQDNVGNVSVKGGDLDIDVPKGASVWFRQKLRAPVIIEYDVTVVDNGRPHERVSDLNCFWMATDPRCPDGFFACSDSVRTGNFASYHDLKTYYVGFGGNNNSTTRFRRYRGNGERPLLPEHDLGAPYLLKPNQSVNVRLTAIGNKISFRRNGKVIFEFYDPEPLTEGYFAFRTVTNHLRVHNIKISTH